MRSLAPQHHQRMKFGRTQSRHQISSRRSSPHSMWRGPSESRSITEVDHYARLGLPRRCPYDQVGPAYNAKVTKLNGQGLDEDELEEELKLLKESYTILSSVKERRLYDWSLARSANPDQYVWPFNPDITQMPTQPPPPSELEDVGPTRLVGSGFLCLGVAVLGIVHHLESLGNDD